MGSKFGKSEIDGPTIIPTFVRGVPEELAPVGRRSAGSTSKYKKTLIVHWDPF